MRLGRKLSFRMLKKHKWKLIVAIFLILTINSLYRKIAFTPTHYAAVCEPIDVVYTWVNGSDPAFISSIKKYDPNFDPARFDDKNELKYSLRSVEKFAPWVRNIYIVTNGQIPKWLDLTNERVKIVSHEILAPNSQWLPTFSSAAIETFIHRIPNLSKRFLYLNDDIFLGSELYPEDLYTDSEGVRIYQAWIVPDCAEDCPWTYIGDGACDRHCNIEACQYDGGDCSEEFSENEDDNKSKEHLQFIHANKKISTNVEIKMFPKNNHLPHHNYGNQNISFKNILLQHKNLSETGDLKLVVDDFNKKRQSRFYQKIQAKSIVQENPIRNKSVNSSQDVYSQSLIKTNMFLNQWYGFRARNVLAHVGFLLEKPVIEAMQAKFYKEITATAMNRFRSPNDLQYAFAYYSFLMEETKRVTVREIFNEFDTDHSMTWSDREIRTFLAKTFQLPLDWSAVRFFEDVIHNCSLLHKSDVVNNIRYTTVMYERYEDSNLPTVTRDLVENCIPLAEALDDNFALRRKYKYHINPKHYIHNNFMMLTSNLTEVVNALDRIRRNPRKFNCINDNLDPKSLEENELIRHLLEDFYLSLFPHRSQFELLPKYRNRFENWKDYLKWRRQQRAILIVIYGLSFLILVYLLRSICIHKAKFVSRCIQKL
ncbi:N-acetylglucosamine-1-phosphotransferase subunits alpha/beta isoform X1 [Lucilia sericata]|uniref:N-acetylglucosamine-1-phosphotransferase subunits alpha/beta isoform X1 n=1 Tax=Lucilia sericata TaxID=13632 RepID=UPI0018A7F4B8|nr:N-acetylglucosamine-1-phosphotransferase subunits alpha/beta isoform X1 [Lucilia sericata]